MRGTGSATLVALGLLALAMPARAGAVDDSSLASPPTPAVYYGTGNSGDNVGWVVDTEAVGALGEGVELGVDTITRFVGPVLPTTANVYNVPLGNTTAPGQTGSVWGYSFSAKGTGGLLLSGMDLSLTITDNFQGSTSTIDPKLLTDSGGTDGTNTVGGGNGCIGNATSACAPVSRTGMQNSEALSFLFQDPLYNSGINDTYLITLTASVGGVQQAQVSEIINAGTGAPVPEPASMALLGSGLFALGAMRRRRRG
jgi:hypothetical protein